MQIFGILQKMGTYTNRKSRCGNCCCAKSLPNARREFIIQFGRHVYCASVPTRVFIYLFFLFYFLNSTGSDEIKFRILKQLRRRLGGPIDLPPCIRPATVYLEFLTSAGRSLSDRWRPTFISSGNCLNRGTTIFPDKRNFEPSHGIPSQPPNFHLF
jgi:hypothetical protein